MSLDDYPRTMTLLLGIFVFMSVVALVIGLAAYYVLWVVAVCWILSRFGYTFSGIELAIPVAITIVLYAIVSSLGGKKK